MGPRQHPPRGPEAWPPVPVPEGALLQDTLTQRCPSAHPGREDEPHLGPGLLQLERTGPTLWPGHYSSLGQMGKGSGKTLGATATWAGAAFPRPESSTQAARGACLVVQELPCTPTPMRATPLHDVLSCSPVYDPMLGSHPHRLCSGTPQAAGPKFSLPRPPLGRQELLAPCLLTATAGATCPFLIK